MHASLMRMFGDELLAEATLALETRHRLETTQLFHLLPQFPGVGAGGQRMNNPPRAQTGWPAAWNLTLSTLSATLRAQLL